MMWCITFHDDKNNRHWSYGKIFTINVRNRFVSVEGADGFRTRENKKDFTRIEIEVEE